MYQVIKSFNILFFALMVWGWIIICNTWYMRAKKNSTEKSQKKPMLHLRTELQFLVSHATTLIRRPSGRNA